MSMPADRRSLLIVGSGVFGTSTAISFLEEGGWDVRIIDRSVEQPAPDAASSDINKITRAGDYADFEMARLSFEAVQEWRKPEWEGTYHESGIMVIGPADKDLSWIKEAYTNLQKLGITPKALPTPESIRAHFAERGLADAVGEFANKTGYFNPAAGWSEATRAVKIAHRRVRALGGTIEGGKEVASFVADGKHVNGVRLVDGEIILADQVIVATGAWTPSLFHSPELLCSSLLTASGQSVGKWILTDAERAIHDQMPVIWDFEDGAYVFPPTTGPRSEGGGIIKTAIHHLGYINPDVDRNGCSVPRTVLTPGAEDGSIPTEMVHNIRKGAAKFFPRLAQKDFEATRMCWYSETSNGDWLIDRHPAYDNVLFATGGSGHAFKFLPNLGRLVFDRFFDRLSPVLTQRFSFLARGGDLGADLRPGVSAGRKLLQLDGLCDREDLKCGLKEKLELEAMCRGARRLPEDSKL